MKQQKQQNILNAAIIVNCLAIIIVVCQMAFEMTNEETLTLQPTTITVVQSEDMSNDQHETTTGALE